MVRELADRGVLDGDLGGYRCVTDVAEVTVPATLHATLAARIDRLAPGPKRTLNAAAVIGSRLDAELLDSVVDSVQVEPLSRPASWSKWRGGRAPSTHFAIR